jgi:hypothetical protein
VLESEEQVEETMDEGREGVQDDDATDEGSKGVHDDEATEEGREGVKGEFAEALDRRTSVLADAASAGNAGGWSVSFGSRSRSAAEEGGGSSFTATCSAPVTLGSASCNDLTLSFSATSFNSARALTHVAHVQIFRHEGQSQAASSSGLGS